MAIPPGMGQNQRQFCDALKEEIKRDLDPVVDETVEQVAVAALEGSKQSVVASAASSVAVNMGAQSLQGEYTPQSVKPLLATVEKSADQEVDGLLAAHDKLDQVNLKPIIEEIKPHARNLKDQAVDASFFGSPIQF